MAVGEAGITMGDGASRRMNPATGIGVATSRPDRGFDLISAPAGTTGDPPRRIRPLRPLITARRLTRFRTGYVSRTQDLVRLGPPLFLRSPDFLSREAGLSPVG